MAASSPGAFESGLAKHERMCYSGRSRMFCLPAGVSLVLKGLGSIRIGPLGLF